VDCHISQILFTPDASTDANAFKEAFEKAQQSNVALGSGAVPTATETANVEPAVSEKNETKEEGTAQPKEEDAPPADQGVPPVETAAVEEKATEDTPVDTSVTDNDKED
jgi:hypothetical protein